LPYLRKNGIYRTFGKLHIEQGKATMTCKLKHIGGHAEVEEADMPLESRFVKSLQNQVMSASSYLRRLLFGNMLGVPVSDTDNVPPTEPAVPITEEQLNTLHDLLFQADADKAKFLAFANVAALADIPQNRFETYCKLLQKKITTKAKT
jgi:hypothetical protein